MSRGANLIKVGLRPLFWMLLIVVALGYVVIKLLNQQEIAKPVQSISTFLSSAPPESFSIAEKGRPVVFPGDHASHPSFRQEWWYFTGNLQSENGDLFGYQLTFFRFSQKPFAVSLESEWQTANTWMAHFTLTDVEANRFYFAEDFSRGAVALAGAQAEPFSVWINSWSVIEQDSGCLNCLAARVSAAVDDIAIDLTIASSSPPVLQGDRGFSKKNQEGTVASYYYSYPSMVTEGTIRIDNIVDTVTGSTWMDREWSSAVLTKGQSGWDWFALHLDNQTRLMLFQVRDENGNPYRTAHLMRDDGSNSIVTSEAISMTPTKWWRSPSTGSRYPIEWELSSVQPDAKFSINIKPQIVDQELDLAFRYYEGAVFLDGEVLGEKVSGQGYMELTGYEETATWSK